MNIRNTILTMCTAIASVVSYAQADTSGCGSPIIEENDLPANPRHNPLSEGRHYKPTMLPRDSRGEEEFTWRVCNTNSPGELENLLEGELYEIDSLVVNGPLDSEDFRTLWRASFEGRLTVINLEKAEISDDRIPDSAFLNAREQLSPDLQWIYCIRLRRIILPNTVRHIGESAFSYAINLREINIPASLESIGEYAFSDCIRLSNDPLVIPAGVGEIPNACFRNCESLTGSVVLPESLKRIGTAAFFQSKISEVNLPEGLESMGECAFYATCLKEALLPEACTDLPGGAQFMLCLSLKEIHLPEGLTHIPSQLAYCSEKLERVNIPSSVKRIESGAFHQCKALAHIDLPEGLESIGTYGLWNLSSMEKIVFPSTLVSLGMESCGYWRNVKAIYCKSPIPPECIQSTIHPGYTPFSPSSQYPGPGTPPFTPVFVPAGTADIYRNTPGWDYFINFIETDVFPSGVAEAVAEGIQPEMKAHDLMGRPVREMQDGRMYILDGKKVVFRDH